MRPRRWGAAVVVMIFRLIVTTVEEVTLELPSLEAAQRRAVEIEAEVNRHQHHGERTTVVVVGELAAKATS